MPSLNGKFLKQFNIVKILFRLDKKFMYFRKSYIDSAFKEMEERLRYYQDHPLFVYKNDPYHITHFKIHRPIDFNFSVL